MVWSWFPTEKQWREGETGAVAAVRFLRRAVVATMGCFFGCFGVKDSQPQFVSPPEPVVSRNKTSLSSLLVSDEDYSLGTEEGGQNSQNEEVYFRELKEQAKFLKACGTLAETPNEIRKASERWVDITSQNGEQKPLNFNSWLPNASIEKFNLGKQSLDSPQPVKICEEGIAGSVEDTPTSCLTDGLTRRQSTSSDLQNVLTPKDEKHNDSEASSVSPGALAPSEQFQNKSVRFDCDYDRSPYSSKGSTSESASQHSKGSGSAGHFSLSKPSVNPTPLKLTDEMLTPGTVFPRYLDNLAPGKTFTVRSQFVYPVPKPVDSLHQWEEYNSNSNDLIGSHNLNDEATPMTVSMLDITMKDVSVQKEMKDNAGLDSWSKPLSSKHDDNKKLSGSSSGENVVCRKVSGDRPILGMVAAHWNDDENSRISPKWWDGNGIPNSTNKYKEDQKVSWHATPFEERLEKALSEETFISKRKPISGTSAPDFNDTEESDTALSHLQSSTHLSSVVSF
ncbi:protein JASON-like isoform X1 [Primulina eburnea]|uniref:protein JASON-like isoform X1 n=1 Tax=Primulina eburnea TaxID=1245227 RepID=UPI003C6C1FFD